MKKKIEKKIQLLKCIKNFLFVVLLTNIFSNQAKAYESYPFYGVLDSSSYTLNGSVDNSSYGIFKGSGVGLGIEDIEGSTSIEFDLLLVQRSRLFTINYIQLPLIYRMWFETYFNFGLGAYYGYAFENKISTTVGSESLSTVGFSRQDAGIMASFEIDIPTGGFGTYLIDTRYEYGLYNVSTNSNATAKFDDLQVLIGVRIESYF